MRAVFVIQPLIGLPWVFACLNFTKDTMVFNYLFVIAGGLQVKTNSYFSKINFTNTNYKHKLEVTH